MQVKQCSKKLILTKVLLLDFLEKYHNIMHMGLDYLVIVCVGRSSETKLAKSEEVIPEALEDVIY